MPTAIVTGAARGIGEAIARLHATGYRVALRDIDLSGVEQVAADLGDAAQAFEHDVRELESWERPLAELSTSIYCALGSASTAGVLESEIDIP